MNFEIVEDLLLEDGISIIDTSIDNLFLYRMIINKIKKRARNHVIMTNVNCYEEIIEYLNNYNHIFCLTPINRIAFFKNSDMDVIGYRSKNIKKMYSHIISKKKNVIFANLNSNPNIVNYRELHYLSNNILLLDKDNLSFSKCRKYHLDRNDKISMAKFNRKSKLQKILNI